MVKTAASSSSDDAAAAKRRTYKGVRMRSWGSWVSEVRAPGQKTRIWLGSHATAEAAARAHDAALLCLRGSAADLNLPLRLPFDLPPAATMSPKAIQRVAAAAASASSSSSCGGGGGLRAPPPFAPRAENNGTSACSDGDGDATPASSTTSSPTSHADDVSSPDSTVSSAGDVDYYTSLADIDAFFQSPKCVVDYALMDPCSAFFAPDSTAADDDGGCCWAWEEDGGGIALWSFSATLDC
ncbi:Ethylene-responsive transcription factor ERF013 [Zea mays]|uniref:AP2-EREBP transcription factor n=1 Tax=Zea mays TaxID=4577 RepID=B8A3G0_MAIZE|eukprot:NP_001146768.1 AP2-EREBP transcription factor [Zea mays]